MSWTRFQPSCGERPLNSPISVRYLRDRSDTSETYHSQRPEQGWIRVEREALCDERLGRPNGERAGFIRAGRCWAPPPGAVAVERTSTAQMRRRSGVHQRDLLPLPECDILPSRLLGEQLRAEVVGELQTT